MVGATKPWTLRKGDETANFAMLKKYLFVNPKRSSILEDNVFSLYGYYCGDETCKFIVEDAEGNNVLECKRMIFFYILRLFYCSHKHLRFSHIYYAYRLLASLQPE